MLTLQKTTVKISVKKCISAQSISTAVVLRAPIMQPHLWSTDNINSKSNVKQHQAQQHNMFSHFACTLTVHMHYTLYSIPKKLNSKFNFN